ncbi:MAG: hypothetical protein Q8P18_01955 [Pseudomonadota bacterium]|nr:hypothetical protein [Pseudomonadota bacterium]
MRPLVNFARVLSALALATVFAGQARADETLLRRTPGSWFYGPTVVFTPGSTSTPVFYPLSEPVLISGITKARFSYMMTRDYGDCKLRAAVRFSNDGTVFSADGQPLATYSDSEGELIFNSAYADLLAVAGTTSGAWVQFGVQVVNRTGSTIGHCFATVRVEPLKS